MAKKSADSMEFKKIKKALAKIGYKLDNRLGERVCGNVYKAKCKDDGNEYAIKVMPYDYSNRMMKKYQKRELELLTRMELTKNSNVIKYFKSWIMPVSDGERLCIQMELCSLNLEAFISHNKICGPAIIQAEGPPKFYEQVFEQILNGLVFIHSIDWVHRDIHPGNILIANPNPQRISDIHVKIADFGLARHVGIDFDLTYPTQWELRERYQKLTPLLPHQTMPFAAPEIKSETYDFKADVYSLGVVLYSITRYPVLHDSSVLKNEVEQITEGKLDVKKYVHHKDEKLIELIQQLLKRNPDDRPTAYDAKEYMFPTAQAPMIEFFARKDNETRLVPCQSNFNDFALSPLKRAVESGTGVEADRQALREERMINGETRFIKIRRDADVKAMFAKAEEKKRDVVIVVSQNVETGQMSFAHDAVTFL